MIKKISKKSLGKIIEELQLKFDDLKEGDYLNFDDFSIISNEIIKEPIIPENWYLEKTKIIREINIIGEYFKDNIKTYEWDKNWCSDYYPFRSILAISESNGGSKNNFLGGNSDLNTVTKNYECQLISFEDFEKYIYKNKVT